MKQYPSISKEILSGIPFYCFDKLDGSNIRAEWSRKNSFYKFGARHRLLDAAEPVLGPAVELIKSNFEKELHDIFIDQRQDNVVCFFEFYGPGSFAGNHVEGDKFNVSLIDVSFYKKGIIDPRDFLKLFGNLDIAKMIYHGNVGSGVTQLVKESNLPCMTFEGIVCKASLHKNRPPSMFKVKSDAWLNKLKNFCNGDDSLYQKLL